MLGSDSITTAKDGRRYLKSDYRGCGGKVVVHEVRHHNGKTFYVHPDRQTGDAKWYAGKPEEPK